MILWLTRYPSNKSKANWKMGSIYILHVAMICENFCEVKVAMCAVRLEVANQHIASYHCVVWLVTLVIS